LYVSQLVTVPWQTIGTTERRTIQADAPVTQTDADPADELVESRLAALGYRS
jgi:hypothetical protein